MKLRLHAGELRFRLKQDEVARLAEGREVDEAVAFGPQARLTFAVVPREDLAAIAVSLHEHRVVVELPAAAVRDWAGSDEEGLYRPADGPHPAVAVEKDFKCLHREGASEEGAFPNPRAGHG
jgi:hypothetical protein